MLLFISHASEDKPDFVRPLAERLRQTHQVWYDEYELTIGDSLRQKIDQGLRACDFGVVVLSPAFFSKNWPQAELDGLFALETTTRKIILPVWKDVSKEQVLRFSPILAGRLAAVASEGIEKVVADICKTVEVSNRTREISSPLESSIQKALSLDQNLNERRNAERLSHTPEGVALVREAFMSLPQILESAISEIHKKASALRFSVSSVAEHIALEFNVSTGLGVSLSVGLQGLGGNWTDTAELSAIFFEQQSLRHARQQPHVLREIRLKPSFQLPTTVVWVQNSQRSALSTEALAADLLDALVQQIQNRIEPQ